MTREWKLEPAIEQKKFRPLVVDVTDDEHFNWLHSMRTPEQNRKDREVMEQFKERIRELRQLELEEAARREREDLTESNQASACNEERGNRDRGLTRSLIL